MVDSGMAKRQPKSRHSLQAPSGREINVELTWRIAAAGTKCVRISIEPSDEGQLTPSDLHGLAWGALFEDGRGQAFADSLSSLSNSDSEFSYVFFTFDPEETKDRRRPRQYDDTHWQLVANTY